MGRTPLLAYLCWHYSSAYRDASEIGKNIIWFLYHFFSLPVIVRTFFSPLFRIRDQFSGFDLEGTLETVITNTVMRLVGMTLRIALGISGLMAISFFGIGWALFFVVWTVLPILIIMLFGAGVWLSFM